MSLNIQVQRAIDRIEYLEGKLEHLNESISYFSLDEIEHRISIMEFRINEIEKKLDTLIKVSKVFSKHINSKSKHFTEF
jgi:hypothetical protein